MENQKGSTLISVVISASMLVAIGLASATMIYNQSSSVTYLEDRLAKVDFQRVEMAPVDVSVVAQTNGTGQIASCAGVGDANPEARKCQTLPSGVSGTPPFSEGVLLASSSNNFVCINSAWTSIPKAAPATPTAVATGTPAGPPPCRGHMAYIAGRLVCSDNQK